MALLLYVTGPSLCSIKAPRPPYHIKLENVGTCEGFFNIFKSSIIFLLPYKMCMLRNLILEWCCKI